MSKEYQKHDRFIKAMFANVDNAREYFEVTLPEDLLAQLDLSTIQHANKSFVNHDLREFLADVVFEVKLRSGKSSAYASILLEHKSKADKYVTVQQGHYIFLALMDQIKNGAKKLKPIIPVLFYHGREKWDYHTHRSLYEGMNANVLKYIPDFEYVYHNLQAMSDHDILLRQADFWNGIFLMLKHAHDQEYLIKQASIIFSPFSDESGNQIRPVLVYFFSLIKNKSRMIKAIEFMPEPVQGKARNAYEELILEGMEKGMEKGKIKTALNFFKLGVSLETISKATGLSEEELDRIIREEEQTG